MNSLNLKNDMDSPLIASGKFRRTKDILNEKRILTAKTVIPPFHELSTKAGGLGHINIQPDSDGIVRKVPLLLRYQKNYFPSFSLQLALKYGNETIRDLKPQNEGFGLSGLSSRSLNIPTDDNYRMFIDFNNGYPRFKTYSFSDVLQENVPPDTFRKKIVLLGVTADDMTALYKTAYQQALTPVIISAYIVENIVNNRYISRPAWASFLEVVIILYFGFFLSFVISKVNPKIGALILASFLITWFGQ